MNKQEFVTYIAEQNKCTKAEAEKNIDMFTSSVIDAMGQGNEISLVGFRAWGAMEQPTDLRSFCCS